MYKNLFCLLLIWPAAVMAILLGGQAGLPRLRFWQFWAAGGLSAIPVLHRLCFCRPQCVFLRQPTQANKKHQPLLRRGAAPIPAATSSQGQFPSVVKSISNEGQRISRRFRRLALNFSAKISEIFGKQG